MPGGGKNKGGRGSRGAGRGQGSGWCQGQGRGGQGQGAGFRPGEYGGAAPLNNYGSRSPADGRQSSWWNRWFGGRWSKSAASGSRGRGNSRAVGRGQGLAAGGKSRGRSY